MKVKLEGHIRAWHFGDPHRELVDFYFEEGPMSKVSDSSISIVPYTIEVEVESLPDSEKLTVAIIAALREQKQEAYAAAARQANRCDDRIAQLLALTNEVHDA